MKIKLKNKVKTFGIINNIYIFASTKLILITKKVIMKLRNDRRLQDLAKEANKKTEELSTIVINELLNKGLIEDDEECYGKTLSQMLYPETPFSDIISVLIEIGIEDIYSKHFDGLLKCVLMGEGECPECGGKLEVTDSKCREVAGDGYNTPLEYEVIWAEKTCINCGYIDSDEPTY